MEEQELWLVAAEVLNWHDIHRCVDLVLEIFNVVKIFEDLFPRLWVLIHPRRIRLNVLVLTAVQINDVEESEAVATKVIEVFQLHRCELRHLFVGIEELHDGTNPVEHRLLKLRHIVHGEHLKDVLEHQPDPLRLVPLENIVGRHDISHRYALLLHNTDCFLDVV